MDQRGPKQHKPQAFGLNIHQQLQNQFTMTTQEKEARIKELCIKMLEESHRAMCGLVEKAMRSGAVDIEGWDPHDAPMITPACIVSAILQSESDQRNGAGTGYEKRMKKQIKNLRHFI